MNYTTKEDLIEELGVHFEQLHLLSPLAARIYAILLIEDQEGKTFEELTEMTAASKSTVSNSINLLLQAEMIEYFTITGDRKRYFRKKPNHFKSRLDKYLYLIDKEITLFDKTISFFERNAPERLEENKPYLSIYKEYLDKTRENMKDTLDKLKSINQ